MLFMLTDILKESTELLVLGEGADEIVERAFGVAPVDNSVILPGVVSRKKQLMPMLLNVFSICGVRLVWVLGVFPFYRSVNFLYLCYPISWGICTLAITGYYVYCRKKLYQKELPQNA